MSATTERITSEALLLSEDDRAHLAKTLLQSLDSVDEGVEEAWVAEVDRRLDQVHDGTAEGRPAEEAFRDIRARYE